MERYIIWIKRLLPTPLSIAFILTLVSFAGVVFLNVSQNGSANILEAVDSWGNGLWSPSLMVFAMQMMLMLVLGHALALSPIVENIISSITALCTGTSRAALIVCASTMLVGLFNWGLGLIFGAILARKVGEKFTTSQTPLNYALIGAAGYSALMIWHGGLSGSALIKAAEVGSIHTMLTGVLSDDILQQIPGQIPIEATIFSLGNIIICSAILVSVSTSLWFIGKIAPESIPTIKPSTKTVLSNPTVEWVERIDHSRVFTKLIGGGILFYALYLVFVRSGMLFFTPNNINLALLGLCLFLHPNVHAFLSAIDSAIRDASGILIQFPLYFGIMGLIRDSGGIAYLSDGMIALSNKTTYPLLTYLSAGVVNIFVPSGGGQWVVQGPIILKAAHELGIPFEKSILALAYGDQITNMLQPFWALPLLGITRLSARDILPYTLVMFLVGFTIYFIGLTLI